MIIEKAIQHHDCGVKYAFFDEDGIFKGSFFIAKDEIWDVMIFKRFRGNKLCVKMLQEFLDENPGTFYLYVARDNPPARKSYENLGFRYIENRDIDFIDILKMKRSN